MSNVSKCARRILGGLQRGTKERIFPWYISFDEGRRPTWWRDELASADWGVIWGVHEYESGSPSGAIVVAENGLALFGASAVFIWLPYTSITGWGKLSKDPVSKSLRVECDSGECVELPFHDAEAFAFVQFLGSAIVEKLRSRERER